MKGSVILNKKENSAHIITRVVKDNRGEITAYEFENGDLVSKEQAVMLAKQGTISGVSTSTSKKGEEFLRSLPDSNKSNNLDSLPIIDDNEIY
jgi:uncharacterized protein YfdQ (DUF2303 family)